MNLLDGPTVDRKRTRLRADLEHALVLSDGLDQKLSLLNGQRKRLFGVNVDPRGKSDQCRSSANMGRSRDEDAVQFLLLEHPAVVCILSGFFRFRSGFFVPIEERGNLRRVAVANGLEIHFLRPIQKLSDSES